MVQDKEHGDQGVKESGQSLDLLLVGNWPQRAREGAGMRLGQEEVKETGQHGRLVGRNRECYLGPTESEKTSCNASRDA